MTNDIGKLLSKKRKAHLNAHSGEFLHQNISLAMEHLKKASPEAQKSLFRALFKDVVVYEDKVIINMIIEESEPDLLDLATELQSEKEKRPIVSNRALTVSQSVSTECLNWLPLLDNFRTVFDLDFRTMRGMLVEQAA